MKSCCMHCAIFVTLELVNSSPHLVAHNPRCWYVMGGKGGNSMVREQTVLVITKY